MFGMCSRYFFLLLCFSGFGLGSVNRCDEVRKVFQLRQIGPNQLVPLSPRPGRCYRDEPTHGNVFFLCVCVRVSFIVVFTWRNVMRVLDLDTYNHQRQITSSSVTMTVRMLSSKYQPPTWEDLTDWLTDLCPLTLSFSVFLNCSL